MLFLEVMVQKSFFLVFDVAFLLLNHPGEFLGLFDERFVFLPLIKRLLFFLLLFLWYLAYELLVIVVLHDFTADSLLLLHFF